MIKRTHDKFNHLVNPNFDLSAVVQDPAVSIAGSRPEVTTLEKPFSSHELVTYFNTTFHTKYFVHNPY